MLRRDSRFPAILICLLAMSVLSLAPSQAPAQDQTPAEQLQAALEAGSKYLEEDDYENAVKSFSQVIQATKNNLNGSPPAALLGRALAYFHLEEYNLAIKDYKTLLDRDREYLPALVGRGEAYLEQGYADAALPDFQKSMEVDRTNPKVLFGLGKSYIMLGGWEQGTKPLTKYIEFQEAQEEPKDEEAIDELAEAYRLRSQGYAGVAKYPEAMADIQKAAQLDPDQHETYFIAGTILLRQEMYLEAIQALNAAIEHYVPTEGSELPFIQGYLLQASVYQELGKKAADPELKQAAYEGAIAQCERLLAQLPETPPTAAIRASCHFTRGVSYRLMERYADAIDAFSEALRLNPELVEAYFRRGICFQKINEDNMALSDFQTAAALNYEDPRPRLWEGFTLAKMGNYHEAVRAYGDALAESDRYTPAYVNRGLAYLYLGDYDKAVKDFSEAIRVEPANAKHYFMRGIAHSLNNDHQKAVSSFTNAIEFDKTHAPSYRHLADELTALGHNKLADEYRRLADKIEADQAQSAAGTLDVDQLPEGESAPSAAQPGGAVGTTQ